MAKRFGKPWGKTVSPRPGIIEAVQRQLIGMQGQGKMIMLCFTCDPYPIGHDSTATRDVIRAIKESGNHVQILTKGGENAERDFDLLDEHDSFGVTYSGACRKIEPYAADTVDRLGTLIMLKDIKPHVKTWVSCEPVFDTEAILSYICSMPCVDLWRIGKLNHCKSNINWQQFGHEIEALCKRLGRNYYIKEDLRAEMKEEQ
jgi:DNA repair photolyase